MARRTKTTKPPRPPCQALVASVDVFETDIVLTRYGVGGAERRLATAGDVASLFAGAGASASAGRVAWWPCGPEILAVGLDADGDQRWLVHRPAGPVELRGEFGKRKPRLKLRHCPALIAELTGRSETSGAGGKTVVRWKRVERVYAVAAGAVTARSVLYAPPFPNIHEGGRPWMCNVRMERMNGQRPLEAFENAYFGSAFTYENDAGCLSKAGRKRWRSAWHLLDSQATAKRRIDLAWLKREGTFAGIFGGRANAKG